ncbi:hypothetical protein CS542_10450 [Pedobacter sp. IW39]|nr:hypothetical protein CS542_10450 [Pedobacter sp. IW39]
MILLNGRVSLVCWQYAGQGHSGLKSFFNYLMLEQFTDIDPAQQLDFLNYRKLPDILNVIEINAG